MEPTPHLIPLVEPDAPEGVVLVLHGGADRRGTPVSTRQLSVLRMVPVARSLARAGAGRLAVYRLLNTHRGWDPEQSPTDDVTWALGAVQARFDRRLPTVLVGHSLGGRAALLSAGLPEVRGVVALAPWVYPDDVPRGLDGQSLLIVHGTRDRVASLERATALAQALARRTPTRLVRVPGGGHAMLRHAGAFVRPAVEHVHATLLDAAPHGDPLTRAA